MASLDFNGFAYRIELDHEETEKLVTLGAGVSAASIGGLLTSLGVAVTVAPIVAGAIALHAAWQLPLIASQDKGNGVILVLPAPAGVPVLGAIVIPYTRYAPDNTLWSSQPNSSIGSSEGDILETKIEAIADTNVVNFVLNNQCPSGWDKAMIVRDGLGGDSWNLAKASNRVEMGILASQRGNGQHLSFWKPKEFGVWNEMINIRGLEQLQPGSLVTFTWIRD